MKNIKHLLFLSILCSLVLFNACSEDEDPVADDNSTAVLDADGDGVADAEDTCADTPSGETVDSSGCSDSQKDADEDGVADDLDTCADTPETDLKICLACFFPEEGEDASFNELLNEAWVDLCPGDILTDDDGEETVLTAEIIEATKEIYEDPEVFGGTCTLFGGVDENGCGDSQKDTDGDGVTDDLDTCTDTPEGATVDINGCSDSQKDTDGDGVSDDLDTCADTTEGVTVDENGCAVVVVVVSAEIGDALQGGIVAYLFQEGDSGYVAGEIHGLIAATEDQSTEAEWGCYETRLTGADGEAIGTGAQNTLDIIAGCSEDGIAAKIAAEYEETVEGVTYDDWFLPSKEELYKLYLNRDAIGGFTSDDYWSSTEFYEDYAEEQWFSDGYQSIDDKNSPNRVRAVRTF